MGTEPCRNLEGSFGAVELALVGAFGFGDDTVGNAVTLNEVTLSLSDCRSCSTATMEGRLVIEDEGNMPNAPIAGGRGPGAVVGLGGSSSGLEAYAESVASPAASPELELGVAVPLGVSTLGVCASVAESSSCDCRSRNLDRASINVACALLSSSKTALDSASISTGSGGSTGFRAGNDDDRGVCIGDTPSACENEGGGNVGDASGEGAAEGAADPAKRKTFAKSANFIFVVFPSVLVVSDFFNAGILSTCIGGGFLSRVLFVDFADLADLMEPSRCLGAVGASRGSSYCLSLRDSRGGNFAPGTVASTARAIRSGSSGKGLPDLRRSCLPPLLCLRCPLDLDLYSLPFAARSARRCMIVSIDTASSDKSCAPARDDWQTRRALPSHSIYCQAARLPHSDHCLSFAMCSCIVPSLRRWLASF